MATLPTAPVLSKRALSRRNILHVGYELEITPDVINLLPELTVDPTKILDKPIVAVMYRDRQSQMNMWFTGRKPTEGFIQGIFHDDKGKYLVAHVTIGATHHWVTLFKGTNISPINLKRKVSNNELGKEQRIEKIKVWCTPYIWHERFERFKW